MNDKSSQRMVLVLGIAIMLAVVALIFKDQLFKITKKPIGIFKQTQGVVVSRHASTTSWNSVRPKDRVLNGDIIATQASANAVTKFDKYRKLSIGSHTKLRISDLKHGSKKAILVFLDEGVVSASMGGCTSCPPIIIQTGNDQFAVKANEEIGVVKEKSSGVSKSFINQSKPKVKADLNQLNLGFLKELQKQKVNLKIKKEISVEAPQIKIQSNQNIWSWKPLDKLTTKSISLGIVKPRLTPQNWHWMLEVIGKKKLTIKGRNSSYKIPVSMVQKVAKKILNKNSSLSQYQFQIQSNGISGKTKKRSAKVETVFLTSLASIPQRNFLVELDQLTAKRTLVSKVNTQRTRYKIYAHSGIKNLTPYINGSQSLNIRKSQIPKNETGLVVIKKNKITAFIQTPTKQESQKIAQLLGNDFYYYGSPSQFIGNVNDKDLLGKLVDQKSISFVNKSKSIYVNSDFYTRSRIFRRYFSTFEGYVIKNSKKGGHSQFTH